LDCFMGLLVLFGLREGLVGEGGKDHCADDVY
jgi:hypothetical protein